MKERGSVGRWMENMGELTVEVRLGELCRDWMIWLGLIDILPFFFLCSYCVSCKYPYSVYMWNCLTGTKQPIGFVFSHSPNQKFCAPLFISPGAVLTLPGVWNFELAPTLWKLKAFTHLFHLILGENKTKLE